MGRDGINSSISPYLYSFQSTRPHGARRSNVDGAVACCCFNPRARMGRDLALGVGVERHEGFQSTRPHGARLPLRSQLSSRTVFQSTRPHGARLGGADCEDEADEVSIHAPAWGATHKETVKPYGESVFQSTRPHGARPEVFLFEITVGGFNPRARMGRDLIFLIHDFRILVSIHAPAWGATSDS